MKCYNCFRVIERVNRWERRESNPDFVNIFLVTVVFCCKFREQLLRVLSGLNPLLWVAPSSDWLKCLSTSVCSWRFFCFLFSAHFNDSPFEFVSGNHFPSGWLLLIHFIFSLDNGLLLPCLGFRDYLPIIIFPLWLLKPFSLSVNLITPSLLFSLSLSYSLKPLYYIYPFFHYPLVDL